MSKQDARMILTVKADCLNADYVALKFSESFLSANAIVRADILSDLLAELNDVYSAALAEMRQPNRKGAGA